MKTKYLTIVSSIIFCSIILFSCTKEDALYEDSLGNVITPKSPKHPITGKRFFRCDKLFSTGSYWLSYEFETVITQTHQADVFIIGSIKLDNTDNGGQKIETNSNFTLDQNGYLRGYNLKSNYDNTFNLYGVYDSITNKINLTMDDLDGGSCECREQR